ncbi:MAG: thiolase family protein [Mycobacteriaceae bacterium]
MQNAVIVDAVRTPLAKGKPTGFLHQCHPTDLLAETLQSIAERNGLDPSVVDDVIGGCVDQIGDQAMNITRNAVLAAGWPESVPATTVDRQCGSSQQAAHFAAQGVMSGAYEIVIACGVESMSRVPIGAPLAAFGDPFSSAGLVRRYPEGLIGQGISAELIAAKWNISRTEMDTFAAQSHARAVAARNVGAFDGQLTTNDYADESIREGTTVQALAGLKPAYFDETLGKRFPQIQWNVTAGNASTTNDGASAVLIMSETAAKNHGLTPRARFHSFAVAGDDPLLMLTAIIPATKKVVERSGLSINDIDLFEVNEAFASVVLAWQRETQVDLEKVNVHGGAIALGHPLGASGCRLMTTLVNVLEQQGKRWGLQVMCEGGGMANATIIELM